MSLSSWVTLGKYSEKHSCGYCGQDDTAHSFGFYAPMMNVETYEAMLNKGWRRSGRYMYKPDLLNTCCRLYSIRMEATKFKSRREHRKDVNRFNRYIKGENWDLETSQYAKRETQRRNSMSDTPLNSKRGNEFDVLSAVHAAEYNTLINTPRPKDLKPAHKFTLELDNDGYTTEKYMLYEKYQRIIHHESKHEITPRQFERFLCSTPFRQKLYTDEITEEQRPTGSFHQLYRIDGVLVAIAVLDFLPNTISSVYFIYDPDSVGKFGMGKVSALREVAMCVEGGYKYYGLGLFAFGCEKLRYKAEIQPSELLDPRSYLWYPFEKYKPHFDQGERYVTFYTPGQSLLQSPLDADKVLLMRLPGTPPYDPGLDSPASRLFDANVPAVWSRDMVVSAEAFWGRFVLVREDGELKEYWKSQAARDASYREEFREMVGILGSLVFEMIICIS